jgi:hypothetical protein
MIDECRFGRMRVADEVHTKDLIAFAPGVRGGTECVLGRWVRKEGHSIAVDDLAAVADARPSVLVIGCGAYGRVQVPAATLGWLRARGIETEVCSNTAQAAARYNELSAEGRRGAGAFHLTC